MTNRASHHESRVGLPARLVILRPGSVRRVPARVAARTLSSSEQGASAAARFGHPVPGAFARRCVEVVLIFGTGYLLIAPANAQVNTNVVRSTRNDSSAETSQVPPLPTIKSPVTVFRELL